MFSFLESIAIIAIVICQFIVAYRVYGQIKKLNSFLPKGNASLALGEYDIPTKKISKLKPSDIVGKRKYRPGANNNAKDGEDNSDVIGNDVSSSFQGVDETDFKNDDDNEFYNEIY